MPKFKCEHGHVKYYITKMPACCGVSIVYDVTFFPVIALIYSNLFDVKTRTYPIINKKEIIDCKKNLYKAFHEFLKTTTRPMNFNRCKLLMSDAVLDDFKDYYYPSIYEFCTKMKWNKVGKKQMNGRSSNYIQLFELNKEVDRNALYQEI